MKKDKFNPIYKALPNIRFSLRLTEELEDKLFEYSTKKNISVNSLILECIRYAFNNIDDFDK